MAFAKGGSWLSTPRAVTTGVSLVLIGLVLLSLTAHLPAALAPVRAHRLALALGGYGVLLAGVLLRRL